MDLILGLLDTSEAIAVPHVAEKARSLTIDWSRFKASGPILEDSDLGRLLGRARDRDHRYCLVQAYGHVLAEVWKSAGEEPADALELLARWVEGRRFVVAGHRDAGGGLDRRCLLVDLERWHRAGRPRLDQAEQPVETFPPRLADLTAHLAPEEPAAAAALGRYLDDGISRFDPAEESAFEPAARRFLDQIRTLVTNLRRGVFVWNVETYADVEQPPAGLRGPLSALYTVAAGLKPNRILETHGFDAATRVVFYDYSEPGLTFRRLLCERWDGRDYPDFLRRLFTLLPPERAHYCLWEGVTPDNLDWQAVEARWQQEVDAWGGASVLARHWARYRHLPHELVHCDLFGDRGPLLDSLEDRPDAVIWWSNAFFSYVSNWYHTAAERRATYRRFLTELTHRAPRLWLYGASSDNVAVNDVAVAEYRRWFEREGGDELEPGKLHRHELRF